MECCVSNLCFEKLKPKGLRRTRQKGPQGLIASSWTIQRGVPTEEAEDGGTGGEMGGQGVPAHGNGVSFGNDEDFLEIGGDDVCATLSMLSLSLNYPLGLKCRILCFTTIETRRPWLTPSSHR